jgi:perosamine synthetase
MTTTTITQSATDLSNTIRSVIADATGRSEAGLMALHEPTFEGNEWNYVRECLDTGWVSSAGKYVDRLETDLINLTGARHAVATNSGTSALHVILKCLGANEGHEILVPDLTFFATAAAVAYCGSIPHLVDISPVTLAVDAEALDAYLATKVEITPNGAINRSSGRQILALVVVHIFGMPADLNSLSEVCRKYGIHLLEDACEAVGSLYEGKHVGHFGKAGALSFNGNKIVTAGGGGAILTDDDEFARQARHLTTTAKESHAWAFIHDEVGFNYRLPNLNAALACAQLEQLDGLIDRKKRLHEAYMTAADGVANFRVFTMPNHGLSNFWLNAILLAPQCADLRDAVLDDLTTKGIGVRPAWQAMHKLPMHKDNPSMPLSTSKDILERIICLPSSPFLADTAKDVSRV